MTRIVTFGEIMARMAPPGVLRLQQVLPGSLDVTFAGAEANVAASLALLGVDVDFVTALPESPLTQSCLGSLRSWGVGTQYLQVVDRGRFGLYFVEMGANQRPSRVYYDRDYSAISLASAGDFPWDAILHNADWLHLTGITPALSRSAAESTLEAAQVARQMGVSVSFDVNFRSRLWRWDTSKTPTELARETLRDLMPFVNLFFGNEEDARLLGVDVKPRTGFSTPSGSSTPSGLQAAIVDAAVSQCDRVVAVAEAFKARFPSIRLFASTVREQYSASHNNWGAMLYDMEAKQLLVAPLKDGAYRPYEIRNIVDRVGSGDAFDAGLLFGLTHPDFDLQGALEFATAAACLAHSITGDTNFSTRKDIEELVHGCGTGRVVR